MNRIEPKIDKYAQVSFSFCSEQAFDSFPDTIKVNGSIHIIAASAPESFADKAMVCKGSLWTFGLSGDLPRTIITEADLVMPHSSKVKKLPDNLIVLGDVDIQGCAGIKSINERSVILGKILCSKDTGFCHGIPASEIPRKLPIPKKYKSKIVFKS